MSRFDTFRRRHLPTLALLALALGLVFGITNDRPASAEVAAAGLPLRWLLLGLGDALPGLGGRAGAAVLAAVLAILAASGLFFATWRLTRNRAVSWAAAFLAGTQPALAILDPRAALPATALLGAASWALAVQARPGPVAPRFPNRPPSRFRAGTFFALIAAVLVSPQGFLVAPAIIVADLVFDRDDPRDARAWASYLPYALVGVIGLLIGGGPTLAGGEDPGAIWRGLLLPGRIGGSLLWDLIFALGLGAAALLLMAEVGLGLGRRHTLVRFGAFGFGWTAVGALALWLLGGPKGREAFPMLAIGLIVFGAVVAWRFVTALLPPRPEEEAPAARPALPAWSELREHFDLAPLPEIAFATPAAPAEAALEPAAARAPLVSLLARIESPVLGVEEGLPLALFREAVRPRLPEGGRLLEFTPHGRFSPYSGILAALGRTTRLIVPTRDGGEPASEEFRDIAGVSVRGVRDDGDWAIEGQDADFVLFAFGLGTIDPEAARRTLDRLAGCAAPGARLVGMLAPELRTLLELDEASLADFARTRGFEVEADDVGGGLLCWRRTAS